MTSGFQKSPACIWLRGARAAYVGPGLDLDPHRASRNERSSTGVSLTQGVSSNLIRRSETQLTIDFSPSGSIPKSSTVPSTRTAGVSRFLDLFGLLGLATVAQLHAAVVLVGDPLREPTRLHRGLEGERVAEAVESGIGNRGDVDLSQATRARVGEQAPLDPSVPSHRVQPTAPRKLLRWSKPVGS